MHGFFNHALFVNGSESIFAAEGIVIEAPMGIDFRIEALIVSIANDIMISIGKFQVSRQDNFECCTFPYFALYGYLTFVLLNNLKAN